jgi:hypothetical protein
LQICSLWSWDFFLSWATLVLHLVLKFSWKSHYGLKIYSWNFTWFEFLYWKLTWFENLVLKLSWFENCLETFFILVLKLMTSIFCWQIFANWITSINLRRDVNGKLMAESWQKINMWMAEIMVDSWQKFCVKTRKFVLHFQLWIVRFRESRRQSKHRRHVVQRKLPWR